MHKDLFNKILQTAVGGTDPEEVQRTLQDIQIAHQHRQLTAEKAYELFSYAYGNLQKLTQNNPQFGQQLILDGLLPLCLKETSGHGLAPIRLHQCREVLGKWVNDYPSEYSQTIAEAIYEHLREPLAGQRSEMACWVVSHIGFRTPSITSYLWRIADRKGKAGNAALAALIDLGCASFEHERCIEFLLRRMQRDLEGNTYAVQELADERLLGALSTLTQTKKIRTDAAALGGIIGLLARIADAHSENGQICDAAVSMIADLHNKYPQETSGRIYLGSDVLPKCNSSKAPALLLNLLIQAAKIGNSRRHNHVLFLRLNECCMPRQLPVNDTCCIQEITPVLLDILKSEPQTNEQWTSLDNENKVRALDAAFHLGIDQPLKEIDEVLSLAGDGGSRHDLLDIYACFPTEPLPKIVRDLVCSAVDMPRASPGVEFLDRTAALRLIRSAISYEALSALLQPSFTVGGHVLRDTGDALVDVVMELTDTENQREEIVTRLFDVLFASPTPTQISGICCALLCLARSDRLSSQHFDKILVAIEKLGLDEFPRSLLISCIGYMDGQHLSDQLSQALLQWALRDDRVGRASLQVLARLGLLHKQETLLSSKLGLSPAPSGWDWHPASPQVEDAAFIISLIYEQHPDKFEPAMESIIRQGGWLQALNACVVLRHIKQKDQTELPSRIALALVDGLKNQNTLSRSELWLFDHVAQLAPEKMLQVEWHAFWKDWIPDARVRFADVLGRIDLSNASSSQTAQAFLIKLMDDSQHSVRRSSYRSLARLDPKTLIQVCTRMSKANDYETRLRAAEAFTWIPAEIRDTAWKELYEALLSDIHASVRAATKTSYREGCKRSWAQEYLSSILELRIGDKQEMLSVWKYGRALAQIGDDETLARLEEHLTTNRLRPNIRHFLGRLSKLIEKTWERARKTWPEPLPPLSGQIRTGTCALKFEGGEWAARYSIWGKEAQDVKRRPSWGGLVTVDKPKQLPNVFGKDAIIKLEDNQEYDVFIYASSYSGMLNFSGGDSHPF